MFLEKGDKVKYLGNMPYILGNGQRVNKEGDELMITSKVAVQDNFFKKVENKVEPKQEVKEEAKEEKKPVAKKTTTKKDDNK